MKSEDRDPYLNFLGHRITYVPVSSHYQWLYQENPHGKAITWLAIHRKSDEIIGCTSIFPRRIWFRGQIILGCVGGDTFVDPNFRRRGIAKQLHQISISEMRETGIKFHYGFPNSANLGAFLKSGGCHPGNFREMRLLLRSQRIVAKLKLGETLSSRLTRFADIFISLYINFKLRGSTHDDGNLKKISRFSTSFDKLVEEVIPSYNVCCVRDSEYLTWRYFGNPLKAHTILSYEEEGSLHGFAAIEFCGDRCIIFDFFVRNEQEIVRNFLCNLIRYAITKNSNSIISTINPEGLYYRHFLTCGFKSGSHSTELPLMVLTANEDEDIEYMRNIGNWYLTHGDYDIESIGLR